MVFFVLLSASPDIILSRINRKSDRLLPTGKPSEEDIAAMLRQREECFSDLSYINIDTGKMGVEEAAELIADQYRQYLEKN